MYALQDTRKSSGSESARVAASARYTAVRRSYSRRGVGGACVLSAGPSTVRRFMYDERDGGMGRIANVELKERSHLVEGEHKPTSAELFGITRVSFQTHVPKRNLKLLSPAFSNTGSRSPTTLLG